MSEPFDYNGKWKTLRWDWKKMVARSNAISSPAKHVASQLCDSFANSKSACVWAQNDTLAKHFGVKVRTIQRHLAKLASLGFLRKVRIPGKRRTYQLVFPAGVKTGWEHDTERVQKMTSASSKHDKAVALYTNPRKNQSEDYGSYIVISEDEIASLDSWKSWIESILALEADVVLEALSSRHGFCLPCRFPSEDEGDRNRYLRFFQLYLEEK